jgi:phage baseplate assembly protein W
MQGIGPALPLARDVSFGTYNLITSYTDEIKQNFKNLVLTSPGERVMNTDFGVGLRKYLFENYGTARAAITQRLDAQVNKYMPYVVIEEVLFHTTDSKQIPLEERNILSINIVFSVPDLNLEASININTEGMS